MAKKTNIQAVAILGVTIMTLALVFASSVGIEQNRKLAEAVSFVVHTHETLEQLELVLSTIKDAETGQRGFVITNQESYLDPFNDAITKLEPLIDNLGALFQGRPAQLAKVAKLKTLLAQKISELKKVNALRRTVGFDPARDLVATGYGNNKMRDIRALIREMKGEEETLLMARTSTLKEQTQRTAPMFLLLMALAITALLSTAAAMIRFLQDRQNAQELASSVAREANKAKNSLDLVLSNMADGLYQLDLNGRLVFMNASAERILGYTQDELIGKDMNGQIHRPAKIDDQEITDQLFVVGATYRGIDDHFIRKDKTMVPVRYSIAPLKLDDAIVGSVLSFTDMTEQKSNEQRTAVSHKITAILARAATIDEAIGDILKLFCENLGWSFGRFWRPISAQKLVCKQHWLNTNLDIELFTQEKIAATFEPGKGLVGRVWQSQRPVFIADLTEDKNFPLLKEAQACGLRCAFAFPVLFEESFLGVLEFVSCDLKPRDKALEELLYSVSSQIGLFIQRRNAESDLILTEERFELAIQGAHDGIWDWDLLQNTCFYSAQCKKQLGYSEEEIANEPEVLKQLVHPDDHQKILQAVQAHLQNNQPYDIEFRARAKDGSYRWIQARGQAVRDQSGRAVRMAGSHTDISERKEAERRVSEFYSSVSHELRTPLTSIRGSLSLMEGGRAGQLPPRAVQLIKIARAESERLVRLINDILDIKKIEAGKLELRLSQTKPSDLIDKCLSTLKPVADSAEVSFVREILVDDAISCDIDRCLQVLTNLVSNAIKYSNEGQSIIVKTTRSSEQLIRFSVTDHGIGIAQNQLHKLFGLFQQVDSSDSRSQQGGTGLGLAISKAIVEEHGGNIGVYTEIGEGATFWFELPEQSGGPPVTAVQASVLLPSSVMAHQLSMRDRAVGKARVLIIEDDQTTRNLIKDQLQVLDVECLEAGDGLSGLELMRTGNPDLVILDVGIPHPDGFDLVACVKEEGRATPPMIVYTAQDLSNDDKLRLRLGLTAYLTKTQTSETQFLKTVTDLLNGLVERARVPIAAEKDGLPDDH